MKIVVATLVAAGLWHSAARLAGAEPRPDPIPRTATAAPRWALQFKDLEHALAQVLEESVTIVDEVRALRSTLRGFIAGGARHGKDYSAMLGRDLSRPEERTALLSEMRGVTGSLPEAVRVDILREAIGALVGELNEPGSKLYGPGEYRKNLEELGYSLGGVGVYLDDEPDSEGLFRIVQVMQGFPSEKQGILPGDRVLRVDGVSMKGVPFAKLAGAVRGAVGTSVDLEMQRGSAVKKYRLQREWLRPNPQGAAAQMATPTIGWIRVKYLGLRSDVDVAKLWQGLQSQGAKSLILDVRNCPGELHGVGPMAGLMLPQGSPTYVTEHRGQHDKVTTSAPQAIKVPLVVLINDYSGDAASTLAGSLRDAGRAVLIGQATKPQEMKAYRWSAHDLSDGSTLCLVTDWVRLSRGQNLTHTGLQPDLLAKASDPTAEVTGLADDKAFQRAIKFLQNLK